VEQRNGQADQDAGKFQEHACKIDDEDGTYNQAKFLSWAAKEPCLGCKAFSTNRSA
jgi:hypothetical protein